MTRRAMGLRRGWREGGREGDEEREDEEEESSARTCAVVRRRAKPFKFFENRARRGGRRRWQKKTGKEG